MRLRVLTYNIHKAIGTDGRFAPERIVALLRRYSPDVALLQEVDHEAPRSRMMDLATHLARAVAYDHHAIGLNVTLKKGWYGNATLSRFPIGRQRNINLTVGRFKSRGAQHTCLHIPHPSGELTVEVFNVHLSLLARLRRIQIHQLLETKDIMGLDPRQPCIVAGDMNDWRGLLMRQFRAAGFACATNRTGGHVRAIRTFPSTAPAAGLDKVFYRGSLRPVWAARSRLRLARLASDHLPLFVDFELE